MEITTKQCVDYVEGIIDDLAVYTERIKILAESIGDFFSVIADLNGSEEQKAAAYSIISHQDNIRCFADMIIGYINVIDLDFEAVQASLRGITNVDNKEVRVFDQFN